MSIVKAWAQMEPKGKLQPYTFELDGPSAEEVEIEIENCGLCHTDLAVQEGDFGVPYPIVAGHEITGKIVAIGLSDEQNQSGNRTPRVGKGELPHSSRCGF